MASPRVIRAPTSSWRARPGAECRTEAPAAAARSDVASELPPSTTTTSTPSAEALATASATRSASSSAATTTESLTGAA
jgi:hypothetical protein